MSYGAGIINNYLLHRRWTFRGQPAKAGAVQFGQFAAVSLSALAVNTLLVAGLSAALVSLRLGAALSALLAKGLALAVGLAWNWTLNQRWTFRPARSER